MLLKAIHRLKSGTSTFRFPGPILAASVAAIMAAPAIRLPFLADDWANLKTVSENTAFFRTPVGYFRPLTMATYWLELRLCGPSPAISHLVNLALICVCAALVVLLVQRYLGQPKVAALTGVLFAVHPYHVENAAWIAARPDVLYSCFFFLAAISYDRWRVTIRGI